MKNIRYVSNNIRNSEGKTVKDLMYLERTKIANKIRKIRNESSAYSTDFKSKINSLIGPKSELYKNTDLKIREIAKDSVYDPLLDFNKIVLKKYHKKHVIKNYDLDYYNNLEKKLSLKNFEVTLGSDYDSDFVRSAPLYHFLEERIFTKKGEEIFFYVKKEFQNFKIRNEVAYKICDIIENSLKDFDLETICNRKLSNINNLIKFRKREGCEFSYLTKLTEDIFEKYEVGRYEKNLSHIISGILGGNSKAKENVKSQITSDFEKGFICEYVNWIDPKNPNKFIFKKFKDRLKNDFDINIDPKEFLNNRWYLGLHSTNNLQSNLYSMLNLEEEKNGSVKILFEDYNINSFVRYPRKVLLNQIINKNAPYGLLVYAKDDHNGAFDRSGQVIEINSNIGENYKLKIFEVENKSSLVNRLDELNSNDGEKNKPHFFILNAHGNRVRFILGNDNEGEFQKKDVHKNGFSKLTDLLGENASILLNSCSTGKKNGIAQEISKLGFEVNAPNKPSAVKNIKLIKNNGKFDFDVEYTNNGIQMKYKNGELVK